MENELGLVSLRNNEPKSDLCYNINSLRRKLQGLNLENKRTYGISHWHSELETEKEYALYARKMSSQK